MATGESYESDNHCNTKEIHPNEIQIIKQVGEGSFGIVYRGTWNNIPVAIKNITRPQEKASFLIEVKQLSRVDHENIIKLFGACTEGQQFFLVLEFAEGGSLFNVLHRSKLDYSLAHALSWTYQCAKGVEYLHNMKPKPLIHRDLKPPNLLLVNGGINLKICDFGTAADKNTYMTNNRGSVAWMAPEVFKSNRYTEKCDVFSWGIILWEVLSRKKPFFNRSSTFSIMWAVHMGVRPPLLHNCPPCIEKLMSESWDPDPDKRPSMQEIAERMDNICSLLYGANEPIQTAHFLCGDDYIIEEDLEEEQEEEEEIEEVFTDISETSENKIVRTLPQPTSDMKPLSVEVDPDCWELDVEGGYEIRTMPGLDRCVPKSCSRNTVTAGTLSSSEIRHNSPDLNDDILLNEIEPHLRPVTPDTNDPRSVEKYEEHKKLIKDYFRMQTEIVLLSQRHKELLQQEEEDNQIQQRLINLQREKESLRVARDILDQQKNENATENATHNGTDGWVIIPQQDRQNHQ